MLREAAIYRGRWPMINIIIILLLLRFLIILDLQAVGGCHGPGQPEHLVLLAILHHSAWLTSTGYRQGISSHFPFNCVYHLNRCSGWATTCQDHWVNIHCWRRSQRWRKQSEIRENNLNLTNIWVFIWKGKLYLKQKTSSLPKSQQCFHRFAITFFLQLKSKLLLAFSIGLIMMIMLFSEEREVRALNRNSLSQKVLIFLFVQNDITLDFREPLYKKMILLALFYL